MAKVQNPQEEEFITLDDDEIDELFEEGAKSEDDSTLEPKKSNKLLYTLIALLSALFFIMIGVFYYIYQKKQKELSEINSTKEIISNIEVAKEKLNKKDEPKESYDRLVKKAKELYKSGKRDEALKIQKELSTFSDDLALYNKAIAKIKQNEHKKAIELLKQSSTNEKLQFESYLNIAICAYRIKDDKEYKDYLLKAIDLLPSKKGSKLYSYYRFLIDYYRGFFLESLVPLKNRNSNYYDDLQNHLSAKIFSLANNTKEAIKELEKRENEEDFFTLALLYAKQKDYDLAKRYFDKSIKSSILTTESQVAKSLVDIKTGMFQDASKLLNSARKKKGADLLYPIKPILRKSLFDPVYAQKNFKESIFADKERLYSLIIYYSPYKIMHPRPIVGDINRGAKNIYIDELPLALKDLTLGSNQSSANIALIDGIKYALRDDLFRSNKEFQDALLRYPNSSELHYNLALNYAKMSRFQDALIEFKRASTLDRSNYLATIYANFCSTILYKDDSSSISNLDDSLKELNLSFLDKKRATDLISIARGDLKDIDSNLDDTIFDKVILLSLSQIMQDNELYIKMAKEIRKKVPNDLLSNILYIDATHSRDDIKKYAKSIQVDLLEKNLDFNKLYDGSTLVRELYIQMLNIAGVTRKFKEKIAIPHNSNDIGKLQTLAYLDIYTNDFEESYQIYNHLTNDLKQNDSHTLLLAAIASIGNKKYANAIALLELAKLTNKANMDSRVALGLLYQESKNLEAASIEYKKIGDIGFISRYFDFVLKK